MTKLKKTILGVVATMALAAPAAHAGLINVAGVQWDPDWTDGSGPPAVEQDFIGRMNFTQWFSTTSDAIGTVGSYGSAVTIGTVIAGQNGSNTASGYYLSGAGEFYQVNDPARDVVISSLTGGSLSSFCPGCELTYAFGGLGLNRNNTFDITNAWVRIYVDSTPDFQVPVNGIGNGVAANATDGVLWLDLRISDLQFTSLVSGVGSGFVSATLEIVGGAAQNNFDPNRMDYNGSAFFGPNAGNVNLDSRYSTGGNGSVLANTIPEPGTIALVGLGLLGIGGVARRRRSQVA